MEMGLVSRGTILAIEEINEISRILQQSQFRGVPGSLGDLTGILGRINMKGTKQEMKAPRLLSLPYFPLLSLTLISHSNAQIRNLNTIHDTSLSHPFISKSNTNSLFHTLNVFVTLSILTVITLVQDTIIIFSRLLQQPTNQSSCLPTNSYFLPLHPFYSCSGPP